MRCAGAEDQFYVRWCGMCGRQSWHWCHAYNRFQGGKIGGAISRAFSDPGVGYVAVGVKPEADGYTDAPGVLGRRPCFLDTPPQFN